MMKDSNKLFLFVAVIGTISLYVHAQTINPNYRYCFNFSWLGPKFNNESIFNNATCDDVTELVDDVPCRHPLVITEDGTYPDMDHLWENYDAHVSCLLVDSEVCASYTYRFDGYVQNITYMCTRVVTDNDASITSGCYKSVRGKRETEVCICRSLPGGMPCNNAERNITSIFLLIAIMTFVNRNYIMNFIFNR